MCQAGQLAGEVSISICKSFRHLFRLKSSTSATPARFFFTPSQIMAYYVRFSKQTSVSSLLKRVTDKQTDKQTVKRCQKWSVYYVMLASKKQVKAALIA